VVIWSFIHEPTQKSDDPLKIKQYKKYINPDLRMYIATQIIKQKVKSSFSLLDALSDFYDIIDLSTINKEI